MAGVHEGDPASALALIQRYAGPLFVLAHRATGITGVAADAVRETLGPAIGGLSQRVPPGDRRWVVDLAGEVYRRLLETGLRPDRPANRVRISPRHWEVGRLGIGPEARPSAGRLAQKLRQRLWRAWSDLTMRQRFVLALSETAQMSLAELADVLGESEASARRVRDESKLALMARLAAGRPTWTSWLAQRRRRRQP